jgi:hypothetical protein
MEIFQNKGPLVLGEEIHKVRSLAMLEYFKKLMSHDNFCSFHNLFGASEFGAHQR